jgi:hypothetical protein
MARTQTEINEDIATVAEDLVVNTFVVGSAVVGDCALQVSEGSAATTVTIMRHPIIDNLGRDAPADGSAKWVPVQAPAAVDAAAGALINFAVNGACWIKFKADKVCKSYLTFRKP